jgi:hypothetical protein
LPGTSRACQQTALSERARRSGPRALGHREPSALGARRRLPGRHVDHQDRERSTGDGNPAEHHDQPAAHRRGDQHRSCTTNVRLESRCTSRRPQTVIGLCGCHWMRAAGYILSVDVRAMVGLSEQTTEWIKVEVMIMDGSALPSLNSDSASVAEWLRRKRRVRAHIFVVLGIVGGTLGFASSAAAQTPPQVVWSQLNPMTSPSGRALASIAYDPATSQLLLFGGAVGSSTSANDTWLWTGTTWSQLHPVTSPPARGGAPLTYDAATGQLLLFGGASSGGVNLNDTWQWSGTNWKQLQPAVRPPAAFDPALVDDPATGQMVLFEDTCTRNSTWMWTGSNWSQAHPATNPSTRCGAALAYDASTASLLLFGGQKSTMFLNDTWSWTGTTWIRLHPPTSPGALGYGSLAGDPASGQLVLFGGYNGVSSLGLTWIWNGTSWTKQRATIGPAGRFFASMAADPATNQLLLFGGFDGVNYLSDSWRHA